MRFKNNFLVLIIFLPTKKKQPAIKKLEEKRAINAAYKRQALCQITNDNNNSVKGLGV